MKSKVKAKLCIKYENKRYLPGEELIMEKIECERLGHDYIEVLEDIEEDNQEKNTNYEEMTNDELKAELDERGIEYNSRDKKEVLISLLEGGEDEQ